VALAVRGGAFEVERLPLTARLRPGESIEVPLAIAGGSWSPGEDPAVFARLAWRRGPGRPEESLVLDAPLHRVRSLCLGRETLRVPMLCERVGHPAASMTVRRRGRDLLAWVEDPGGLEDVRALVRVGGTVRSGGRGVRVPLPDPGSRGPSEARALAFSVGFEGRAPGTRAGRRELRRWAGGLPAGLGSGAPGLLFASSRA
jgi:hypothetical protein